MSRCSYCGNESGPAPHPACYVEWKRRIDAGFCVACGEREVDAETMVCPRCALAGTGLVGYPGGA